MRKVLVIGNYFYPDVASLGQLITDFCVELRDEFKFNVIAAIPNYSSEVTVDRDLKNKRIYNEKVKGIDVIRVVVPNVNKKSKVSRIKYILAYFFNSRKAIRECEDYDVILAVSQPPVLGGLLGKYAKKRNRKARLIYNIQDFNPEQIEAVKYSKFKFLINILKLVDTATIRYCDNVLLVGNDQLETLSKRDPKLINKAVIINNWSDDKLIFPLENGNNEVINFKKKYNLEGKFVVMYSGNIGLFYDLENLIKVTNEFKDNKEIVFVFVGDGAIKKELEEFKKENALENIVFIPYQSKDKLSVSLNVADVHLVVNAKGIKGVSVPSKIYGVMSAGKPIIGVLEDGSEARNIIENAKCGKCVDPQNYSGFKDIIEEFSNNNNTLVDMGKRARRYLEDNLSKEKSIEKYKKLFEGI